MELAAFKSRQQRDLHSIQITIEKVKNCVAFVVAVDCSHCMVIFGVKRSLAHRWNENLFRIHSRTVSEFQCSQELFSLGHKQLFSEWSYVCHCAFEGEKLFLERASVDPFKTQNTCSIVNTSMINVHKALLAKTSSASLLENARKGKKESQRGSLEIHQRASEDA